MARGVRTFFRQAVKLGGRRADVWREGPLSGPIRAEEEAPLSLVSATADPVQISTFAPHAPLSPAHRVGAPVESSGGHAHAEDDRVPPTGGVLAGVSGAGVSLAGASQALGPALPPMSLLPPVESPATIADTNAPADGSSGPVDGSAQHAGLASAKEEQDRDGLGAMEELPEDEQQEVEELKARDREVRQHEQAHMAAAGSYANGGPSYEYTRGPDGKRYATGGEVSIDTSKESEPEATLRKARQIYRAALASAEPSPQDRSVASQAKQMEAEARAEIAEQQREEMADAQEGDEAEVGGALPGDAALPGASAPTDSTDSEILGVPGLPGSGNEEEGSNQMGHLLGSMGAAGGGGGAMDRDTAANLLDLLA